VPGIHVQAHAGTYLTSAWQGNEVLCHSLLRPLRRETAN
jgi:hypothetical protein